MALALRGEGYTGALPEMMIAYLQAATGSDGFNVNELWAQMLRPMGYEGALNQMQLALWLDLGAPAGSSYPEAENWFWCVNGGNLVFPVTYLGVPVTYLGDPVQYSL
jgi:hypothetical protein